MKKGISKIESKHGSEKRTIVTFEEIKEWVKLWPEVRSKVASNLEAYQMLSRKGLQCRDPRTIKFYMEKVLPLVNTKAFSAIINLIDFCENRMSVREFMKLIREKFPIEELGPRLAALADVLIKELPPPGEVVYTLGSVMAGGFPFDATRAKK